jgi:hypothetical protein
MQVPEYYKVTVKIEHENENGKIKKIREIYLVKAGSPQVAANLVEKEMDGCNDVWQIANVKEETLTKIVE